ncbi:hypothetical protein BLNAU_5910 [Blattamonas nauphoetae]|uniref:Uncharacterized protein n=1 Tax=Blattamonas nauphoetae TaxID=2049346 RepID=A0ABQ9Y5T7_9EUKA|nr:hypothetical protein BLNAU_5910 [Blattamonas nauphoetae]
MPPKHKLRKKRNVPQSTPPIQTGQSNISNADIVDSSRSDSIETNEELLIDFPLNQSTNDFLTILPDDRRYVQISKQIMLYETKRRRLHLEPNSVRPRLENAEIPLQNFIESDWRVVSQDSITDDDLEKGCITLFRQLRSGTELSPSEADHAIRLLEYTTMYFKDGPHSSKDFFGHIFNLYLKPKDITSSLLTLISHPSETLRAVALAFFSTGFSGWRDDFIRQIAETDFIIDLLLLLKPHEIPFSDTTMEFHNHVVSIMLHFIRDIRLFNRKYLTPEDIASILQEFCPYLRHLLVHPAFFPWKLPWSTFDSILRKFEKIINSLVSRSSHPELVHFVDEMKNTLSEELASLIGLADQKETAKCLLFDKRTSASTSVWVKRFKCLLAHADEGRHFSDVGIQSIVIFLNNLPKDTKLVFANNGKFTIKVNNELVSSSKHHVRSLWALLTPNQPQHAPALLTATELVSKFLNRVDRIKHFWNGWLSRFLNAFDTSCLPFTPQYHSLHAQLVDVLHDITYSFKECERVDCHSGTISRSELKKCCLSFLNLSKEYLVHLSHNAYANHTHNEYTICHLLSEVMKFDLKNPTTEEFRRELKEEMISTALASSSPPFIPTAELVCALSDSETMDVVERIVGLLDSDSSLDDSTILRMCVFIAGHNTRSLQLAFRNTGRTKAQYLHVFESFLSLHIESFDNAPIRSLLSSRPDDHEPTLDEWDEADLETVPIVMQMKKLNQLSIDTNSEDFDTLILDFIVRSLQQARHCATRLTQTQLARLIAPSIECLNEYLQQQLHLFDADDEQWEGVFKVICSVCDQPVAARAVSKTGLFFQIVNGLVDSSEVEWSLTNLMFLINDMRKWKVDHETERMWRRGGFPAMREEGLEDLIEFRLLMEPDTGNHDEIENRTRCVLKSFGTNLPALHSDYARKRFTPSRLVPCRK